MFLSIAFLRVVLKIKLKYALLFFYSIVFVLAFFVPKEFLPEFYYIKEASSYMLDGITKLCVDYLEKDNENSY